MKTNHDLVMGGVIGALSVVGIFTLLGAIDIIQQGAKAGYVVLAISGAIIYLSYKNIRWMAWKIRADNEVEE